MQKGASERSGSADRRDQAELALRQSSVAQLRHTHLRRYDSAVAAVEREISSSSASHISSQLSGRGLTVGCQPSEAVPLPLLLGHPLSRTSLIRVLLLPPISLMPIRSRWGRMLVDRLRPWMSRQRSRLDRLREGDKLLGRLGRPRSQRDLLLGRRRALTNRGGGIA